MGEADRSGPTQNPKAFINNQYVFKNTVVLIGFTYVFILLNSQKQNNCLISQEIARIRNLLFFHEYPEKRRLFGTQGNSYFILVPPGVTTF